MKVLIAGASGFIGKNFLLSAPKEWNITATYRNETFKSFIDYYKLNNINFIRLDLCGDLRAIEDNHYDLVIFLASNTDIQNSSDYGFFDLTNTLLPLVNLMDNITCDKLIYFSSGAVYNNYSNLVDENTCVKPTLPYAICKNASEQYIKFYKKINRLKKYIILRFCGAFGPHEPARRITSKFICNTMLLGKSKEFKIIGDGKNLIDFIYIDDVINGLFKVINSKNKCWNDTYNFARNEQVTLKEYVELMKKTFKLDDVEITCSGKSEENCKYSPKNDKFNKTFNFKPKISISNGLVRYMGFLKDLKEKYDSNELKKLSNKNKNNDFKYFKEKVNYIG